MKTNTSVEILETRIALNGSAILKALSPIITGSANDYSQAAAIGVASNFSADGLIGFPTGTDDKFVILSTGDATQFNTPGYAKHGTDWTSRGSAGDDVNISLSLPVPVGAKRLKLDFMILTQEDDLAAYPDHFTIDANPDVGVPESVVDYTVATMPIAPGGSTGPNFLSRSFLLTMNYQVPAGASNVTLNIGLSDAVDGTGDTAVMMDNLRFEKSANVVFLAFNGATTGALGPGTVLPLPAFQPADLGFAGGTDRNTVIADIVSKLETKYADFDVSFVTSAPTSGDYTTIIIGGSQDNPVFFTGPSSPLLNRQFPGGSTFSAYTKLAAGTTLFGQALGGVDIGNKNVGDVTVVFSREFGPYYTAVTETPEIREGRMVTTMAHELGHALGLRHVESSDVNDLNIMREHAPLSSDAGFEDSSRSLAADETWPDKATKQNDADYLRLTLGSAAHSDVELGISPIAFNKYVMALLSPFTGGGLYNAYLGVIPGQSLESDAPQTSVIPQMFKVGDLKGDQLLDIPITSMTDKLIFWGQSTPNGPVDIFSGTPDGDGELNFADSGVPLFDNTGKLNTAIPTAIGAPGTLTSGPALGLQESALKLQLLPFGTYEDAPPAGSPFGDSYTVKLTTKTGTGGFTILDPDGDGKGPIDHIFLQDTTSKDKLSITVKKPTAAQLTAGLDGLVDIGAIDGSTLASVDAKVSDLVGTGVDFGNLLGKLTLRDVRNGADIKIGGGEFVKTTITTRDIADGTDIVSRSSIAKLTSRSIGNGTVDAPTLGKLTVNGDFGSDLTLAHTSIFLTEALLKKSSLGSVAISGVTHGASFQIDGSVGSFKTGRFVDSSISLHNFDPTHSYELSSFAATGITGVVAPAFDNSTIIADIIGKVTLASVDTVNGGVQSGVAWYQTIGSITVNIPDYKYDKQGSPTQLVDNFYMTKV